MRPNSGAGAGETTAKKAKKSSRSRSAVASRAALISDPRAPDEGFWLDDGRGRSTFTLAGCFRLSTVGDAYRCQCATAVCGLDVWAVENGRVDPDFKKVFVLG